MKALVNIDVDLQAADERALAAGAKLVVLSDPFGHGFCLLQFLGRGYDEIADPAWGVPAGTRRPAPAVFRRKRHRGGGMGV